MLLTLPVDVKYFQTSLTIQNTTIIKYIYIHHYHLISFINLFTLVNERHKLIDQLIVLLMDDKYLVIKHWSRTSRIMILDAYPHLFSKLSYSLEIGIVRTRRRFYNGRLGNNIFRKWKKKHIHKKKKTQKTNKTHTHTYEKKQQQKKKKKKKNTKDTKYKK